MIVCRAHVVCDCAGESLLALGCSECRDEEKTDQYDSFHFCPPFNRRSIAYTPALNTERRSGVYMTPKNLEEAIQAAGSPVDLLRNSQLGPYVYPAVSYTHLTLPTSDL